jgi:two-component system NtrC family sensor kinase
MPSLSDSAPYVDTRIRTEDYYRDLQRKNFLRLVLTYLAPLILLSAYFYFQYRSMVQQSASNHMRLVAESRAGAMDLFLHERIVNLFNLIDDPKLRIPPSDAALGDMLRKLAQASDAFEDVGFIDEQGIQKAYAGSAALTGRDYSGDAWFASLKNRSGAFIVTDRNDGYGGRPHVTVAVSRILDGRYCVLRASLDPEKLYRHLAALGEARDVDISIVNGAGELQLGPAVTVAGRERVKIVPPATPRIALSAVTAADGKRPYAYAWLRTCDWALMVVRSADAERAGFGNAQINIIAFSAAIVAVILSVIVIRSKKIVKDIRQADVARARMSDNLMHASKLAAVGELASGIAHEINNPLAIISEEVGLIKDMADPQFGVEVNLRDLGPHLDSIHQAVVRCRGITSKLLAFVRKGEVSMAACNLHEIIDEVVNNFYGRRIAGSGVKITRSYCRDDLFVMADRTQLEQVFVNLINNAIDAIENGGRIAITTTLLWEADRVRIDVEDTGVGMSQEQLDKVFIPFYTTKKVGKGTGLGLSVSYAIIRSMEGEMSVTSTLGNGSIFSITLPVASQKTNYPQAKDSMQASQ